MTKNNTVRIALTSFFAYATIASIMSSLGIVSQPISNLFGVEITDVTNRYSYITVGILAGSFIALFIFDWLRVRTILILNCLLIMSAISLLYVLNSYAWLPFLFAIIGISNGINLTAAAVVITRAFSEDRRAPMLLLTDCFYSIGAMGCSFIAAYLMAQNHHWVSSYILTLVLLLLMVILAVMSDYPEDMPNNGEQEQASNLTSSQQSWPLSVHFCAASLFLYLLGMVSLYTWMPPYANTALLIPQEGAGKLVGYFFSGMFASQVIMFFLVMKFPIARLLLISSAAAALINISLWNISSPQVLGIATFGLGLFAGGFFKTFITYGTLAVKNASARLVSYLLFSAGLGTAVAPFISSNIVAQSSEVGGLVLSSVCYVLTFMFAVAAVVYQTNSQKETV